MLVRWMGRGRREGGEECRAEFEQTGELLAGTREGVSCDDERRKSRRRIGLTLAPWINCCGVLEDSPDS